MPSCAGRPETCGSAEKPNDPIDLVLFAAKGEPKRFGLISDDQQVRAVFTVVPFPIVNKDSACSIEAQLMLADAVGLLVRGSGFAANEEILLDSHSEDEAQRHKIKVNESGETTQVILPYVKGKAKGDIKIALQGAKCRPSVSVTWGKGTYRVE